MNDCFICDRIADIKRHKNPNFVAELPTGYIILLGSILYPGYTIFSCKKHATELHELPESFKMQYLKEMTLVAECLWHIYRPRKLNYELLGNSENHLHWHIIPRYPEEKRFQTNPIWIVEEQKRKEVVKEKKLLELVEEMKNNIKDLQKRKRISTSVKIRFEV